VLKSKKGEGMQFEQLKTEIKTVSFESVRDDSVDFFEAVLTKKDLPALTLKLDSFFDKPVFPAEKPLSEQAQAIAADFGDVMDGQTMYFKQEEKVGVFAMLWPWGDKDHITLKVGQVAL